MSSSMGTPRVLILALSNWIGAPRLPRTFRGAGFHVTTLAFSGLLLQRSQAVDEALLLSESISNDALLEAVLAAIERVRPDIVIPTDDASILLLHAAAAKARRASVPEPARAWLATSLGNLGHLPTVRSRKLMAKLAASIPVRAPRHGVVFSEAEAQAFAAEHGYPIVLKEEDSVAGMGVSVCKNEAELAAAAARCRRSPDIFGAGVLVQSFVAGRTAMRVVVAQQGRVLRGLSAIKLETWPTSTGPSTCVEIFEHAELTATSEAVISALGYSGFASLDFMLDADGQAHLIELNPRPTPIAHLGDRFGACLGRQLHAALTGQPTNDTAPQGLPSRVALFPQEWVRDPSSVHLASGVFHDVPWDEPDLVEAYTVFGRGQMRFAAYRTLGYRNEDLRRKLAELEAG